MLTAARQALGEVGTTTGRLRRVGWFDAVLARYAARLNGIDTIVITKLDVLDTLASIKICTGYRQHDTELDYPPANIAILEPGRADLRRAARLAAAHQRHALASISCRPRRKPTSRGCAS